MQCKCSNRLWTAYCRDSCPGKTRVLVVRPERFHAKTRPRFRGRGCTRRKGLDGALAGCSGGMLWKADALTGCLAECSAFTAEAYIKAWRGSCELGVLLWRGALAGASNVRDRKKPARGQQEASKRPARGQEEASKRPGRGPTWGGPHETRKPLKNKYFHEDNLPVLRAFVGKLDASKKPSGQQEAKKRTARCQQESIKRPASQEEASKRPGRGQQEASNKPGRSQQEASKRPARGQQEASKRPARGQEIASKKPATSQEKTGKRLARGQQEASKRPGRGQQGVSKRSARGQQEAKRRARGQQEVSKRPGRGQQEARKRPGRGPKRGGFHETGKPLKTSIFMERIYRFCELVETPIF